MLFSVLAGGCSLSYDTSVGYIVDAYYIDETTGEVVTKKRRLLWQAPQNRPCISFE